MNLTKHYLFKYYSNGSIYCECDDKKRFSRVDDCLYGLSRVMSDGFFINPEVDFSGNMVSISSGRIILKGTYCSFEPIEFQFTENSYVDLSGDKLIISKNKTENSIFQMIKIRKKPVLLNIIGESSFAGCDLRDFYETFSSIENLKNSEKPLE